MGRTLKRNSGNYAGRLAEQTLTLEEAIQAYTMGSAYAEFRENEVGSLTSGKFADLVILDADLFSVPPDQIKSATTVATILGGKTIFARESN